MPLDSLKVERIRSIAVQKMIHPSRAGEGVSLDTSIAITIGSDHAVMRGINERSGSPRMSIRAVGKDTLHEYMVLSRMMEDGNFLNLLQRVDSLKDTVSLDELGKRFRAALDKESMKLDFAIEKDSFSIYPPNETIDPTRTNEVVMGYGNNYFLRYELLNRFQYITRKLSSQIGLSLLLIALTSFTFVLLYRNLMKQRRLTQFKNDLISNITHELKTPIATVSVAIEALEELSCHGRSPPHGRVSRYFQ